MFWCLGWSFLVITKRLNLIASFLVLWLSLSFYPSSTMFHQTTSKTECFNSEKINIKQLQETIFTTNKKLLKCHLFSCVGIIMNFSANIELWYRPIIATLWSPIQLYRSEDTRVIFNNYTNQPVKSWRVLIRGNL